MRKKLNINEHLDTSFEDAWASFIISQTARGISETTLRNYRTHLRAISKHLNISASLSDLSKSDLEAMIVSMRGSGLAHNTIATYLRCVNTFLNWCRQERLADLSIPNIAEKETVKETYTDTASSRTSSAQPRAWAAVCPSAQPFWAKKVKHTLGFGNHGSTFGENPVVCTGAASIIKRMDEDFLSEVRKKSALLQEAFKGASGIESGSGMGLMLGLKTQKPAGDVVKACMEKGVLCLTAKDKVRLLPTLNITEEILLEAAEIIKAACAVD